MDRMNQEIKSLQLINQSIGQLIDRSAQSINQSIDLISKSVFSAILRAVKDPIVFCTVNLVLDAWGVMGWERGWLGGEISGTDTGY